MSWLSLARSRHARTADPPWNPDEAAALSDAVRCAPSANNSRPWTLRVRARSVVLQQRLTVQLPERDLNGRERRISCGAAVANLAVAVRGMGWVPEIRWSVDDEQPNAGATVLGTHRIRVGNADSARWRAVSSRRSYHDEFDHATIPEITRSTVISAATTPICWVGPGEHARIAQWFEYTSRRNYLDAHYQHELAAWIADAGAAQGADPAQAVLGGASSGNRASRSSALGGNGSTPGRGALLLFSTPTDGPRAHFQVGEAAQRVWLEATRLGLVGSVLTQPLRIPRVRRGVGEVLNLDGHPQLFMRLGYPLAVPQQAVRWPLQGARELN